jgi:GT2 family glycosyltransferase
MVKDSLTTDKPKVSIVIVTWNGKDDLVRSLLSLREIEYTNTEIIVVDNGSTDGSLKVLERDFPEVQTVLLGKNVGHSEGLNIGTRYAQGEFIFHLDNDIRANDPALIMKLVDLMLSDEKIGACGPMVLNMDTDEIQFTGAYIEMSRGGVTVFGKGINEVDYGQYTEPFDVDYIRGCALLLRRKVLEKVGLYVSRYVVYYDETDLCLCIKKAGYRVVTDPRAKIMHKIGGSGSDPSDFTLYHVIKNRFLFMRRQGTFCDWLAFLPVFIRHPLDSYSPRLMLRQPLRVVRVIVKAVWWNIKDIASGGWKAHEPGTGME